MSWSRSAPLLAPPCLRCGCRWPATPVLDQVVGRDGVAFDAPDTWPNGWQVSQLDNIRFFNIMGPAWAALDAQLNPWADGLSDGRWEWTVDAWTSRWQALRMISSAMSGEHKTSPLFKTQQVAAFALQPQEKTTYLTVDGEEFPYEPLYMEVHKGWSPIGHPESPPSVRLARVAGCHASAWLRPSSALECTRCALPAVDVFPAVQGCSMFCGVTWQLKLRRRRPLVPIPAAEQLIASLARGAER
jgi:hypothetical protein